MDSSYRIGLEVGDEVRNWTECGYATSIRCSGSGEDGNAIFRTGVEPTEREANAIDRTHQASLQVQLRGKSAHVMALSLSRNLVHGHTNPQDGKNGAHATGLEAQTLVDRPDHEQTPR